MVRYFDDIRTDESRAFQVYLILIGLAYERKIATYGMIADLLGFKGAGTLARILGHIIIWCEANDLPRLTVLVVNQETGLPGEGIGELSDLDAQREQVFQFNWFSLVPPTPEELDASYQTVLKGKSA